MTLEHGDAPVTRTGTGLRHGHLASGRTSRGKDRGIGNAQFGHGLGRSTDRHSGNARQSAGPNTRRADALAEDMAQSASASVRAAARAQPKVHILRSLSSAVSRLPLLLPIPNHLRQPPLHNVQAVSHLKPAVLRGRVAQSIHRAAISVREHVRDAPSVSQQVHFAVICLGHWAGHG